MGVATARSMWIKGIVSSGWSLRELTTSICAGLVSGRHVVSGL